MRKQNKIWSIGLLITIAILISGFCLPYWWSRWQDHQMENDIEEYVVENPALQVNNKLMDKLNVVYSENYTPLAMQENSEEYSEHTRVQIEALAKEQMQMLNLEEGELWLGEVIQTEFSYELLVDAEHGISFGVWDCYFYTDQNQSIYAMIDDESEKILSCAVYDDGYAYDERYDSQGEMKPLMDKETIYRLADQMETVLKTLYGAEEITMEIDKRLDQEVEDSEELEEGLYEDYIYIQYTLTDGQGNTAQVEYAIRSGSFVLR